MMCYPPRIVTVFMIVSDKFCEDFSMLHTRLLLLCSLVLVLLPMSIQAQGVDTSLPTELELERQGFMPEGIVWDAEYERFLTSSVTEGTIFAVTDDGQLTPFIEDDDLVSTFGVHIDEKTNRLLVANSNAAILSGVVDGALSQLAAYDLETGERLFLADLGALVDSPVVMANDVTVDDDGNAYVTDSFANAIFQVTPEGDASILIQDERFAVENHIGLNGIDYHPDGYLLATVPFQLSLYNIPLDAPDEFTLVDVQPPFAGDGIVLNNDKLIAVGLFPNADGEIFVSAITVSSDDDWASATITHQTLISCAATTLTIRDDIPYYITAYLGVSDRDNYQITQVSLDEFSGDVESLYGDQVCRTL